MKQLLLVGAVAVVMTACANLSSGTAGDGAAAARGAAAAGALGYHGPLHRASTLGE